MFIFHYHQMYHKNVLGELFTASRSESHLNTLRDVSCDMINQGNTKTMRSYGAVFFFYLQNHACGFCKQVCLQLKAIRAAWINNTTKCACNYKWFLNTVFTVSTNSSLFSLFVLNKKCCFVGQTLNFYPTKVPFENHFHWGVFITLYSVVNITTWQYCSDASIWKVKHKDFMLTDFLKMLNLPRP